MSRQAHWEGVYTSRRASDVGWYQAVPEASLRLIEAAGVDLGAPIVDVGGGASRLVDHLLDRGYVDVTVLDLSRSALAQSRARLGDRADRVRWIEADATQIDLGLRFALWHDRALFHFLTDASDRAAYRAALARHLERRGHLVLGTFSPDGPERCSGLDVVRYDEGRVEAELGHEFELLAAERETHVKPDGGEQAYAYFRLQRRA